MLVPTTGVAPGKDVHMKKKLTKEERRERQRRVEAVRKIYEEEGITEEDISFMSKPARDALMRKYGLKR